jgi:hypothetical protein
MDIPILKFLYKISNILRQEIIKNHLLFKNAGLRKEQCQFVEQNVLSKIQKQHLVERHLVKQHFHQTTFCQTMFCQMTFCQMMFGQMIFVQTMFSQMTFGQTTFGQTTFGQMMFGQTTLILLGPLFRPNCA